MPVRVSYMSVQVDPITENSVEVGCCFLHHHKSVLLILLSVSCCEVFYVNIFFFSSTFPHVTQHAPAQLTRTAVPFYEDGRFY